MMSPHPSAHHRCFRRFGHFVETSEWQNGKEMHKSKDLKNIKSVSTILPVSIVRRFVTHRRMSTGTDQVQMS